MINSVCDLLCSACDVEVHGTPRTSVVYSLASTNTAETSSVAQVFEANNGRSIKHLSSSALLNKVTLYSPRLPLGALRRFLAKTLNWYLRVDFDFFASHFHVDAPSWFEVHHRFFFFFFGKEMSNDRQLLIVTAQL